MAHFYRNFLCQTKEQRLFSERPLSSRVLWLDYGVRNRLEVAKLGSDEENPSYTHQEIEVLNITPEKHV